ncbi:hypothetical protein POVWA2_092330 [Plasmodium ovale wallikeri]|uniref:Uncharacterized protein n=1 Tax=Plasmodium ovale wallikeri TaxID=864142 RepID=A0A1A9AR28_PLAOA|nr:hypothetical protein POVWA2_092330 [Plasmodium ovale wallikeri]
MLVENGIYRLENIYVLRRITSENKMALETKTDKAENKTTGSTTSKESFSVIGGTGYRRNAPSPPTVGLRGVTLENKIMNETKVDQTENRASENLYKSPLPTNIGLRRITSENKMALETKTDKTENEASGSKEETTLPTNVGLNRITSGYKMAYETKMDKTENKASENVYKAPLPTNVGLRRITSENNSCRYCMTLTMLDAVPKTARQFTKA